MLAPVTHILPVARLHRARMLPAPGSILVRAGQKVNANDVIGRAMVDYRHLLVDVQKVLSLKPGTDVDALIECKVGDVIQKGDVLARRKGVFARYLRSSVQGEILSITGGKVLIQTIGTAVDLFAGFPGIVKEVLPERGVILEVNGALIQGVWGNGRLDNGVLISILKSPADELERGQLDISLRGSIVLAGHCSHPEILQAAGELGLRGLILSSCTSNLIQAASACRFPILVCEGFGKLPYNPVTYRLVTSNEKRDVCLNAVAWDSFTGDRPEMVIPLPAEGAVPKETDTFNRDQIVRIQGHPYTGKVGKLVQVRSEMTLLENGLRTRTADVMLEDNQQVLVPLLNLEVIE
ncbi:MAG TPA: hypothetical protein VIO61_05015 [Anaerolineaceae bacterium]